MNKSAFIAGRIAAIAILLSVVAWLITGRRQSDPHLTNIRELVQQCEKELGNQLSNRSVAVTVVGNVVKVIDKRNSGQSCIEVHLSESKSSAKAIIELPSGDSLRASRLQPGQTIKVSGTATEMPRLRIIRIASTFDQITFLAK